VYIFEKDSGLSNQGYSKKPSSGRGMVLHFLGAYQHAGP
jgi:hypothetical protein